MRWPHFALHIVRMRRNKTATEKSCFENA